MNRADTAALKAAMLVAADAIIDAEPELTRIDKVIGDGDHGIGMKTGFTAIRRQLEKTDYSTPYDLFHACGLCLVKSMGGSSGVLFGTLLIGGLEAIRNPFSAVELMPWYAAAKPKPVIKPWLMRCCRPRKTCRKL